MADRNSTTADIGRAQSLFRARAAGRLLLACLAALLTGPPVSADFLPSIVRQPQRGIFLVANKSLADPNFAQTVVLLTYHGVKGSIGLIVNKSTTVDVISTLPELKDLADPEAKMRFGGPLELFSVRLLVSSPDEIQNAQRLFNDVYFVNSTATLRSLLEKGEPNAPSTVNYYAGYAGWSSGQLPTEIARGDWYLIEADAATIFERDSATVWRELVEKLEGTWVLIENTLSAGG